VPGTGGTSWDGAREPESARITANSTHFKAIAGLQFFGGLQLVSRQMRRNPHEKVHLRSTIQFENAAAGFLIAVTSSE
jgi:hypothetical protein